MQAIQTPDLERAVSARELRRLVDLYASTEAAAALRVVDPLAHAVFADDIEEGLPIEEGTRERFRDTVLSPKFLAGVPQWIRELRELAASKPESGACTIASALDLWLWTADHFRAEPQLFDELAEIVASLLAARALAIDVAKEKDELRTDLSHVHAARASAAAGAACAEIVFGYRQHRAWDAAGCAACFQGDALDELEGVIPGIAAGARAKADVIEADGSHAPKAGPCVTFEGVDTFLQLRQKLDGCLTGARIARDRAAAALHQSMAGIGEGIVQ